MCKLNHNKIQFFFNSFICEKHYLLLINVNAIDKSLVSNFFKSPTKVVTLRMTAVENVSVTVIANQLVDIVINLAVGYVYDDVVPPPVEEQLLSLKDLAEEDTVNLKRGVNNTMDINHNNLKSSIPKKPQGIKDGRKRSVTFDPKFIKDSEDEDDDTSMDRHKTNNNVTKIMTTTVENKAEQTYNIDLEEETEITRL